MVDNFHQILNFSHKFQKEVCFCWVMWHEKVHNETCLSDGKIIYAYFIQRDTEAWFIVQIVVNVALENSWHTRIEVRIEIRFCHRNILSKINPFIISQNSFQIPFFCCWTVNHTGIYVCFSLNYKSKIVVLSLLSF